MKNKNLWINLTILGLFTVAFLGMILRSKMLFDLPFIDYNRLLEAHSHFAFSGWVTLALMVMLVNDLLPDLYNKRKIYQWIFGGIALSAWGMLLTFPFDASAFLANLFSVFFIIITYIFGWLFIKDIRKSEISKTIFLLSVSSIVCLILSSVGPFTLTYLFSTKSLNAILYRDALFTYLHLLYNGFFSLAVFALLFNKLESKISDQAKQNIYRFSVFICLSILPSMFLVYLWHNPNIFFRLIAGTGSVLLLLSFIWFIISAKSLIKIYKSVNSVIRYLIVLSMSAFMLKIFLQSFTVIDKIGDAVFGDRTVIMFYLHLVFLGFVSLFLLAYFAQSGLLNIKIVFTKIALIVFSCGVIINETLLGFQGLGTLFIKSNSLFPWLLWATSILLFVGTILIVIARIKSRKETVNS